MRNAMDFKPVPPITEARSRLWLWTVPPCGGSAVTTVVAMLVLNSVSACAGSVDLPRHGMVLWLDASRHDGTLQAAEELADSPRRLAEWSDLSGLNNHLTQNDVARQPQWVASGIKGKPSVRFPGSTLLSCDGFTGLSIGDQTYHIAIVFQAPRGGPASQRLIDLNSRMTADAQPEKRRGFWVGIKHSRYLPRLGIHDGDEGEALSAAWDDQPHLLELVYSGEQLFEIHVDGRTERQAAFNGTHFLGFHKHVALAVGQHFGLQDSSETWFNGDIAELLIYRRPLTTQERFQLGAYLSAKYTLTTNFDSPPLFERDIQPILATHCFDCHGADTREAGLDLRSVSSMLRGGHAGPVIVRGHPEYSELLAMVNSEKMPPEDLPKLSSAERDLIRRWIVADAASAEKIVIDGPGPKVIDEDRRHWAWQMPTQQKLPAVASTESVRNEIDRFILARLEGSGLTFSPDAAPDRTVRRLCFDLTGLPPSSSEIDSFVHDIRPGRQERLVDRLLLSPHFGERWGRYWLDVAGFVDVNGSDPDAASIGQLPGKWRYRDYVIRSFNDDKPFDQFLIEQLAGDELFDWREADTFTQPMLDSLTATTFLLSANDDTDQNVLNTPDIRHHVLQRVSENVASTLFAVTLQCAKCHDHKYEALSQLDYYQFESVFAPVFNVRNWVTADQRIRPDVPDAEREAIDHRNAELDAEIKMLEQQRDDLKAKYLLQLLEDRLVSLPEDVRDAARDAFTTTTVNRGEEQKRILDRYHSQLAVSDAELDAALSTRHRHELEQIADRIPQLVSNRRSWEYFAIATESPALATTYVLRRGNYLRPGLEVNPELPEILTPDSENVSLRADSPAGLSGRRLALARSVTNPDSLAGTHVARVFVNRVWQQLFGRGIVETTNNLGVSGAKPSHPKLLDWLTLRFVEGGWRVKPLIRLMVLSSTYRQTAHGVRSGVDPENHLLGRMNLRRLDSEQLRDAVLTVSGKLDRQLGGPPVPLRARPDGMVVLKTDALPAGTTPWRRSVYLLARRNYHLTFMRVFDQPIVARNCAIRETTAVVTQSLALLHDDFMLEQSEILAHRVAREASSETMRDRVNKAWRIVLGRFPDEEESGLCLELLERHTRHYSKTEQQPAQQALVQLCHMLMNTSEFLYVQ